METYSYYADGKWPEPASGEYFTSENPYNGETWAQIPRCNENGWEGMRDFLQTKSIWLSTAREIPAPF